MRVVRTFHPIGQGAFYTEVFFYDDGSRFVMVYDCGTETGEKNMEESFDKQIDLFKGLNITDAKIDLLFISHFHADHINGLNRLLENTKVKKTVIPMLGESMVKATRAQNYLKYGKRNAEAADKIIQVLYYGRDKAERFGEIIFVGPDRKDAPLPMEVVNGMLPRNGKREYSGNPIPGNRFWEYIPFNSIDFYDSRARDFEDRLRERFGPNYDLDYLIKNNLHNIKDIYRQVMGSANDNLYTLVLVSRPVSGVEIKPDPRLAHCFYFGDFDNRQNSNPWGRLTGIVDFGKIGMVQVPHHGARENWLPVFADGEPRQYIVSSGTTNGYHHPCYWVISEIKDKGHNVSVVSEMKGTGMKFEFEVQET
jgi:hypothetical protein